MDQLIAAHPFEAPPSLVRQEQEAILRDQVQFMQSQGLNMEGMDPEKMLEHLKPKAERRVKVRLIFDKIAAQENVSLEEGDIEAGLARIAARSQRTAAQLRQVLRGKPPDGRPEKAAHGRKSDAADHGRGRAGPRVHGSGSGEGITC